MTHDYIQWLFPLTEHSRVTRGAPVLLPSDLKAFRSDPLLRSQMLVAFRRMLGFYGLALDKGTVSKSGTIVRLGLVVFLTMLAGHFSVEAQPRENARRIGFLSGGSSSNSASFVRAFREGLRELGWIDGQNVLIDLRFAEGRFDRLPELAAELVRLKADLIVAVPTPAALAAKNSTATIPIVIISVPSPADIGLVASLARPGGNVTGVSFSVGIDIIGKQLQVKRRFPGRVA